MHMRAPLHVPVPKPKASLNLSLGEAESGHSSPGMEAC